MRPISLPALVAALCLASVPAHPAEAPKSVRVFVSLSGKDAGAVADAYASVSTGLASSPLVLAVYFSGSASPEEGRALEDLCKLFIDLRLERTEDGEAATWTMSSRPGGRPLSRGSATRSSSSPAWSDAAFWKPLIDGIPDALAAAPPDTIIVRARPGTEISGIGRDFSMPQAGEVELPIEIPALYSWSARALGAYPERGSAFVKEGGTFLDIPYRPIPPAKRWSVDASFYSFTFPELRAGYSPSPSWFLRATITQFLFGLSLTDSSGAYPSLVYSTGLVQAGLGAGWYPMAGRSRLQPYLCMDAFARLILPEGGGVAIEPIAPMGISPLVGLEWSRAGDIGAFIEVGATLYPIADRDFMLASAGGDNSGRLLFGGSGLFKGHPGWFGEFPNARLGLRFKL